MSQHLKYVLPWIYHILNDYRANEFTFLLTTIHKMKISCLFLKVENAVLAKEILSTWTKNFKNLNEWQGFFSNTKNKLQL